MEVRSSIYGLFESLPKGLGALRYIGISKNPAQRFKNHLAGRDNSHTKNWITGLRLQNLQPEMTILEAGISDIDRNKKERWWIAYMKGLGSNLTNSTDGGEGTFNWNPSIEWRSKKRSSMLGNQINKGRIHTASEKESSRRTSTGRKHTQERKENTRKRMLGNQFGRGYQPSPINLEKLRNRMLGNTYSKDSTRSAACIDYLRTINLGSHRGEAAKNKMRLASRLRWDKPEEHIKAGLSHLGYIPSIDARKKNAVAHLGKHNSPEACEKIRRSKLGLRKINGKMVRI